MTVENISRSISTKVWGLAGINLTTPGSAILTLPIVLWGPTLITWIRQFCIYMQTRHSLPCLHTQSTDVDEVSNLDL